MKKILIVLLVASGTLLYAQKKKPTGYLDANEILVFNEDTIYYTYSFNILKAKESINSKLVVIIPGSGPTDRDGNSALAEGKGMPYKMLADSLSKHNIASIRYDKPGVGKSTFKGGEGSLRFEMNADIIVELIKAKKQEGQKVYLAGHSEGSLIGMLAAQKTKVDGFISLAGPARNGADVLKTQLQQSPGLTPEMKKQSAENLDSLKNGFEVKTYNPYLGSLFRPSVQPYLISWFKYTPTEEITKLNVPVLVIQGEQDAQVPAAAGEALNHFAKNSTLHVYPKMNHVLKTVNSDEENKQSYTDAGIHLSAPMVADLMNWINKN